VFESTVDQTTPQASRYYKGSFDCQSFVWTNRWSNHITSYQVLQR
jgi:hypothetical protein